MMLFYLLAAAYAVFVLWLCGKIVEKTGIDKRWALILLIPVVNIIMIWVFALTEWPNFKKKSLDSLDA